MATKDPTKISSCEDIFTEVCRGASDAIDGSSRSCKECANTKRLQYKAATTGKDWPTLTWDHRFGEIECSKNQSDIYCESIFKNEDS